jgi:hypothetical protein
VLRSGPEKQCDEHDDRIGNFEALMETRFYQQVARFDQLCDQVARLVARPTP